MILSFPSHRPMSPMAVNVIDFGLEHFNELLMAEMFPLWEAHYKEITLYKDIPLSPDLKVYENAENMGMLRIFTARHEGVLVGYEVFFIHTHPHYSSAVEAVQDSLFLSEDLRRGSNGYRFIKWVDEQLKQTEAKVIFRCVSNMNDYGPLLLRMGYVAHDTVYSRRVEKCQQPSL